MRNVVKLIILGFVLSCNSPDSKTESQYRYPFEDPALEIEHRVNDLISRLSIEEKAGLMLYNSPAIDRLGIPEYNWWNECLHGVGRAGKATVFPQAIGLAATFDEELIFRVASAISDEARAKYHAAVKKGNRGQYAGLSFWTPNINIFRDPRWGRGQETYGEDPYLTSRIGISFVRGLQGDHPKYLKTSACAKHYVVHSGPEKSRHRFNALPDTRDFRETYLPGFEALVKDGKVESVMCAYNRTYDEPCCGSAYLLNDILRQEWKFEGHIVSDCWALDDIWARHKVVEEKTEAAAMAANAGVNLNCGYIYKFLPQAIESGLITEATLDEILKPLMITRFKLGMFDPDELNPYSSISSEIVNSENHKSIAYESAVKSIVLLQNKNQVLPLDADTLKNLLVVGPTTADLTVLLGNYNGFSGDLNTMLEGIVDRVDVGTVVEYSQGFMYHNDSLFHGFWQAQRTDAVIVGLGINSLYEGEEGDAMLNPNGGDRLDISLPGNQIEYLKKIKENIGDKPLIVVITGGSAMAIPEVCELADAILFAWYPGEQGGNAIADLIFGKQNPSGRLPVTFYRSTSDLPEFDDYGMEGRTYKYFDGDPLFPFGFGLSYSSFEYSDLRISQNNNTIDLSLIIKNFSERDGEEVVQVYARKINPDFWRPRKQLIGFQRKIVKANQELGVEMRIDLDQLKYWDEKSQSYKIEPGQYEILVGPSSEHILLTREITIP